jgi:hypothetical protein
MKVSEEIATFNPDLRDQVMDVIISAYEDGFKAGEQAAILRMMRKSLDVPAQ